jgi:iron only hydrogenase large subunit-like protein
VKIGSRTLRVAVVNGIANGRKILEKLKKNPAAYDYVEVMACFGGCIGGGGQPVPVNTEIRRKRADALYRIDTGKKVRSAHENPEVIELYKEVLTTPDAICRLCHTTFKKKKREVHI